MRPAYSLAAGIELDTSAFTTNKDHEEGLLFDTDEMRCANPYRKGRVEQVIVISPCGRPGPMPWFCG